MHKRSHYLAVDGIRGLAALSVALYHAGATLHIPHFIPRSFLAVDIFFLLSGFVIAAAYEPKFSTGLTFAEFLRVRLIRLLPMIWLGIALGIIHEKILGHTINLSVLLHSMFILPAADGDPLLFPLNLVEWSLMFEIAINIVHASLLWRIGTKSLIAICGVSLVAVIAGAIQYGSLDTGWGDASWQGGIGRVIFSYTLGVLLWRLRFHEKRASTIPYLGGLSIMGLMLYVPGGGSSHTLSAIRDTLSVAVVFPILFVAINPIAKISGLMAKASKYSGAISYPLYAIHVPLFGIMAHILGDEYYSLATRLGICLAAVAVSVLLAQIIQKHFDAPVRAWLLHATRPGIFSRLFVKRTCL